MKKLFISVPMKGRSDEAIQESIDKMHKASEILLGEKVEIIQSVLAYIDYDTPETNHYSIWCLGRSLQKLAEADYMAMVDEYWQFAGCHIERQVADYYGIPRIVLPMEYVVPEIKKLEGCATDSTQKGVLNVKDRV